MSEQAVRASRIEDTLVAEPQSLEIPSGPDSEEHSLERADLIRIGIVAVAIVDIWLHLWEPFPRFSVIGITATLIGIYPILREALEALGERRMTMELSMTIAIAAALAIGEFFTA